MKIFVEGPEIIIADTLDEAVAISAKVNDYTLEEFRKDYPDEMWVEISPEELVWLIKQDGGYIERFVTENNKGRFKESVKRLLLRRKSND
jgi:sulfite reductase beta subunit-like hemoprotein